MNHKKRKTDFTKDDVTKATTPQTKVYCCPTESATSEVTNNQTAIFSVNCAYVKHQWKNVFENEHEDFG